MTPAVEQPTRYKFKPRPYSSHRLLLEEFPARGEGRSVLDVGCAEGYLGEVLAARGFTVTGIDLPGTPHAESIGFAGADLDLGLPALPGSWDYILCADVLEHLRDPLRLLGDCRRQLAPGGVLITSLPNSGNAYFRWNVLLGRFPQYEKGLFDRTHLHFYTWDGWTHLLATAGFGIEGVRSTAVPVGLAWPRWDGSPVVQALEWLSFQAARLWKTLFGYQFIVRARAEQAA
jgi:SAM-dependent methyltransferase